jgi:phosphatidylserine/phosphatidylglycerophosphate/cardiolipin synthase-like enzyme
MAIPVAEFDIFGKKLKMQFIKKVFISAVVLTAVSSFGQLRVSEGDFSVGYQANALELQFDASRQVHNISITDGNTAAQLALQSDSRAANSYKLTQLRPAQMVKVSYDIIDNGQYVSRTKYLMTPSASSGEIKVYFNHLVDTSYSQGTNAVNLSNTLDDKLIEKINACVATLDMAIYNSFSASASTGIAGAINAAYARGVQVRVVYDGSTTSPMIPLLNAAIPKIPSPTSSSYGIMHNKFVIFDANNADANVPLVWTGSTNWTTVQIDGPDRNSVITVQDQALAQVYKTEFEEMWGSITMVPDALAAKFGPYKTDNTPHNLIVGGKAIGCYFSPSDGANAQIINAINSANVDIDIATMLITRTDLKDAILAKYNGGLTNINIVTDTQNPASNQFPTIQAALLPNHAVKFTDSGIMHHKFMVVDNFSPTSDPLVTVGSHNWSSSAETKNDENMLVVHDGVVANQYYQAFAYLYGVAGGEIILGTDYHNAAAGFLLYPNPSTGIFTLENRSGAPLENANVTVYDMMGKAVTTANYTSFTSGTIDLTNQAVGMYFVKVQAADKMLHYKVMKN